MVYIPGKMCYTMCIGAGSTGLRTRKELHSKFLSPQNKYLCGRFLKCFLPGDTGLRRKQAAACFVLSFYWFYVEFLYF